MLFLLLTFALKQNSMPEAIRDRFATAEIVAKAKHNSGTPVEDKARERQVIFGAVRLAVKKGVDVDTTVKVFSAQIEANKIAQRAYLKRWQGAPPFVPNPDLAKDVRPLLDRLTPTIIENLAERRYWPATAFGTTPSDPALREAWKVAIAPFIRSGKAVARPGHKAGGKARGATPARASS